MDCYLKCVAQTQGEAQWTAAVYALGGAAAAMASALLNSIIQIAMEYFGGGLKFLLGQKLGLFSATSAVWLITLSSNTLMFIGVDPVVMDNITEVPFHLLRWIEWHVVNPGGRKGDPIHTRTTCDRPLKIQ